MTLDTNVASPPGLDPERTPFLLNYEFPAGMRDSVSRPDVDRKIECYLRADGIEDLYVCALLHVEDMGGRAATGQILGFLWASRAGLTLAELVGITGRSADSVALVVGAVSNHLLWRDDRMALSESLGAAAEHRYLAGADDRRVLRIAIAQYSAAQPMSARRALEQPWQLYEARAWDMLRDAVADPDLVLALHAADGTADLMRYWAAIQRRGDLLNLYETRLEAEARGDRDDLDVAALYGLLGAFHCDRGNDEHGEALLRRSLAVGRSVRGGNDPAAAATVLRLTGLTHGPRNSGLSAP
jgi:hypothetical protein